MSSTSRAWIAAASVGAVEALKDQGYARWNYAFRSLHQYAKMNLGAYTQARRLSSLESSSSAERRHGEDKLKKSEESLRKVMYLSCWGPN